MVSSLGKSARMQHTVDLPLPVAPMTLAEGMRLVARGTQAEWGNKLTGFLHQERLALVQGVCAHGYSYCFRRRGESRFDVALRLWSAVLVPVFGDMLKERNRKRRASDLDWS
jgi:hypothetical protein